MIARDLALALDGVAFAQFAGVNADAWQAKLLRSTSQQLILNCSRQSGKSTVCSLLALHTVLYQPDSLVLLLAPTFRQSQELFRKVKDAYAQLNDRAAEITEESTLRLEFSNGSRMVCLPGKEATIRGFSGVSLLLIDEASRVDDALYHAVRPMLAVSGGRLVLLSTPFGQRGFFYHEWTEGHGGERVIITAYECPRIASAWLERERAAIGDWWFQQEYLCEFVETEDTVFSYDHVMSAISTEVQPLFEV